MGGGIFSNGGSLTLVNDTFTGDAAEGGLGGSGNPGSASSNGFGYGGAVFAVNGTLNATFDTFSGNTAVTNQNGFHVDGTDVYVLTDTGSGIRGNGSLSGAFVDDILGQTSANTSDIAASSAGDASAPILTASYDLISNNSPSSGTGLPASGPGMQIGVDPQVETLASNGGPTQTLALSLTSPAVATGITADFPATTTPVTTDQRGFLRGAAPNIGAFGGTQNIPTPTITIGPSSLNLGATTMGTAGTAESYTIGGANLTANVTVTAPSGVQVSDNGGATWSSSLTLTETQGTLGSTTIEAQDRPIGGHGPHHGLDFRYEYRGDRARRDGQRHGQWCAGRWTRRYGRIAVWVPRSVDVPAHRLQPTARPDLGRERRELHDYRSRRPARAQQQPDRHRIGCLRPCRRQRDSGPDRAAKPPLDLHALDQWRDGLRGHRYLGSAP